MSAPLKILIALTNINSPQSLGNLYGQAFRSLGHQVQIVQLPARSPLANAIANKLASNTKTGFSPTEKAKSIIAVAEEYNPDITIVTRGHQLHPEAISRLRQLSSLACINIYTDSPFVVPGVSAPKLSKTFAEYSCVFTFSRALIPTFYQLGANDVQWLPFGYCPDFHVPVKDVENRFMSNVAYVGSWGPFQEQWLSQLTGLNLAIYGNGWKHARQNDHIYGAWRQGIGIGVEMPRAISGANIVFNMVRAEHCAGHSMKTFEIPACGGIMAVNWTEEHAEFFEDGTECIFYNTYAELNEKLEFYLQHPSKLSSMREGAARAIMPHSYKNRAKQILGHLGA